MLFIFSIGLLFLNEVVTALGITETTTFMTNFRTGVSYSDYFMIILILILVGVNFLIGLFQPSNPLTFFMNIFFFAFGVWLAVIIQHFFDAFFQTTSEITPYIAIFPFTTTILQNIVLIYILASSFYLIGLYSKRAVYDD
jgi:hypothetical protein